MSLDSSPVAVPPTADWVDPVAMMRDPYPTYDRLRAVGPVVWVPAVNRYLVTSNAACRAIEADQGTFSAVVSGSAATMQRAIGGRPMLRKDDPDHAADRRAINPSLRPRSLRETWAPVFTRNATTLLEALIEGGPDDADLNRDYAAPVAAQNLVDLIGARGIEAASMHRWSANLIAGIGNIDDDPDVWRRCEGTGAEIDAMLDELILHYRQHPDSSIISALTNGGLSAADVRVNIKLTISGGMNEPQHLVTAMVWALSRNDAARRQVLADPVLWPAVFDETIRLQSPIGMYPRQTTRRTVLAGVELEAGAAIAVVIAAANRDPAVFARPGSFELDRSRVPHLGFGSGVHQCAGHWAARISIGEIAVPMLFRHLPELRVDPRRVAEWHGWLFRGLTALPVTWDGRSIPAPV